MEVRREVGEFHEVAEVLDRAVATAAVQVTDERRPVVGGKDRVHPPDLDVVGRVAGVLGELPGSGSLDELASQAAREANPLPLDVGTAVSKKTKRVGVAAELDADLLED